MAAAEAVGEEGGEGGRVLSQELPPLGQLLQGQGGEEAWMSGARGAHLGKAHLWDMTPH